MTSLLDDQKSEISRRVAQQTARAQARLATLEESLGAVAFQTATDELERQRETLDLRDFASADEAVDTRCPVCGSLGRLIGEIDLSPEMDYDVEPLGGGAYEAMPVPYWQILLRPQDFACTVCQIRLHGAQELADIGLPSTALEVSTEDLGPGFDLRHYLDTDDY